MVLFVSEFRPDSCVVAEVRASPNHGERNGNMKPDMLVLHYTGMSDAQDAVRRLCSESSKVSSHYIVIEDGHIIQSVAESQRAWHAPSLQTPGSRVPSFRLTMAATCTSLGLPSALVSARRKFT